MFLDFCIYFFFYLSYFRDHYLKTYKILAAVGNGPASSPAASPAPATSPSSPADGTDGSPTTQTPNVPSGEENMLITKLTLIL